MKKDRLLTFYCYFYGDIIGVKTMFKAENVKKWIENELPLGRNSNYREGNF
ncbi:hypothetical protein [Zunongwangia sp. H14]|uniref:hypothetical protein n=1 Tax=Zunongwangia sp. H14 TaxID=3240792 RepID=UPI0035626A81